MTDTGSQPATHAGQAVYTPRILAIYDVLVLHLSNPFVWRCPTRRILELYHQNASADHLDVGVGTGWYPDHCRFPTATPRIGLMDLNPNTLAAASQRIARYKPETYRADVLSRDMPETAPFGSISVTYLLHCLPGTIVSKSVVFDNLAPLLRRDGTVFGATLLSRGVRRGLAAQKLMAFYNSKGVFSNEQDSLDDLRDCLQGRFEQVRLETVGCVALFVCRGPRA